MHIRTTLVVLALFVAGAAYAEKPDLTGAVPVQSGFCRMTGEKIPCTVYEKQQVRYVVFRDEEEYEIILIYRIRDGASVPYRTTDFELLWSVEQEVMMTARNN